MNEAKSTIVIELTKEQRMKLGSIIYEIVHCEKENLNLHLFPREIQFLDSITVRKESITDERR